MAIALEITQSVASGRERGERGGPIELPSLGHSLITAEGLYTFTDGARLIVFQNRDDSEDLYVLAQQTDDATVATAANSVRLNVGMVMEFTLPPDGDGSTYGVDVRTVA